MHSLLHIMGRTAIAMVALFVLTKWMGKRQLSQMTFFEYAVGITIGSLGGIVALDLEGNITHGLTAMLITALFPITFEWIALKSKIIRDFVEGKTRILIKDGKVLEDNLKKERMSTDELMEHLRLKNAFKVADVEFAVMEASGQVSVLFKTESQPLTPKELGVKVTPEAEPETIIMDGTILDERLAASGFNHDWLRTELEKTGVTAEDVYLGQIDSNQQLYLDLYDDNMHMPSSQATRSLYVTLKKCQADLELHALSTKTTTAKKVYEQQAKQLQQMIDDLTPLLTR